MTKYVRKGSIGKFSSWHCKETQAFKAALGTAKVGRKSLKNMVKASFYRVAKDDFHVVRFYIFPAECISALTAIQMQAPEGTEVGLGTWNSTHVCAVLHLKGWQLDPADRGCPESQEAAHVA